MVHAQKGALNLRLHDTLYATFRNNGTTVSTLSRVLIDTTLLERFVTSLLFFFIPRGSWHLRMDEMKIHWSLMKLITLPVNIIGEKHLLPSRRIEESKRVQTRAIACNTGIQAILT